VPWPVYSERLAFAFGPTGGVANWGIPAGKRAVIKAITASNGGQHTGPVQVLVAGFTVYAFVFPATTLFQQVSVFLPVYEGENIGLYVNGVELGLHVDGYLFDDTSGATRSPLEFTGHTQLPDRVEPVAA
jgi:hypothetical protein